MEAAKMNAGLFHTRNSPRPLLSGTTSRMINKVNRSAKKLQNRAVKNVNSSKMSGVNLVDRKKGLKAVPRVDCWRGVATRNVPKLNFLAPNGQMIRSGKKCSDRKKISKPKRFCSISDKLPVKKMANKYEEVYLDNKKLTTKSSRLLTPSSHVLLNASGCVRTPDMKVSVTLVPRTSSIMRSKSQTKRNLRSGSIRQRGRIGLVSGLVHRFEETYDQVGTTILRKKPLEKKRSQIDENANNHDDSTLDLRLCNEKYLGSISDSANTDCVEECFILKDDVFDEINGNHDNSNKSRAFSVQNKEAQRDSLSKIEVLNGSSVRYTKNSGNHSSLMDYSATLGNNTTLYKTISDNSEIIGNNTTLYRSMIDNSAIIGNNTTLYKSMIDNSAIFGNKTTIDEIGLEASEMLDDNDTVWTSAVEDNSASTIYMDCSSNETTPVIAEQDKKKSRLIPSDCSREEKCMDVLTTTVEPLIMEDLESENGSLSARTQRCSIS